MNDLRYKLKLKARHTFFIFCSLFLIYSFRIYLTPLTINKDEKYNKEKAAVGRLVWQKYNCQSCHQLFGLGGYLGPDLTNVLSHPKKGETLLRALIKTGTKQMPAINISENETQDLIEFLRSTNASGKADPRSFKKNIFGMIEKDETK